MKQILILAMAILFIGMVSATPLGIIDSKYVTIDSTIGGPVWQVTVRGDNDASYTVFGDKSVIKGTSGTQTVTPATSFTLKQTISSESCNYNLINTGRNPINNYKIDFLGTFWFSGIEKAKQNCYDTPGGIGILAWGEKTVAQTIVLGAAQDVYCLKETHIANVGIVQEGKINFNADFSIQKEDSTTVTKTITTLATNTNEIPSNILFTDGSKTVARIYWIGGSTFGETCPGQDNYVAIEKDKWYTADLDKYILYNDQYVLIQELVKTIKTNKETTSLQRQNIRTYVNAITERGDAALKENMITADGTIATITGSNAKIQLPRDHLIYAPDFQILISADWVGTVYQTSKPKIIDAGFNSCNENGSNTFYATIQNVGTQDGQFNIGATCLSGITVSATSRTLNLAPGNTGTITIPFSLDLSKDQKETCTITISDKYSANEDKKAITTDCTASTFCTVEGQKTCAFAPIEKICSAGQWIPTASTACENNICNRDNKCDSNKGESFEKCGGSAASNNDCATCNLNGNCDATETIYSCPADCGNIPPTNNTWLYIAGGILLAAAVFYGLTQIKPKKKGRK